MSDVVVKSEAWEDDEVIITFDGKPVGATLSKREGAAVEYWMMERGGVNAATTHTEQRERRMLAEWLEDTCDTPNKLPHGGHHVKRKVCYACVLFLMEAISKGLAPTDSGQWPESEVG